MSRRLDPQRLSRRPTVSVVIPCYNYGHYLPSAVRSVLEQPEVDVDVIVIDDASPDGSAEVVRSLAAIDDRVRAVLHSRNRGHIATYNEGLEQAQGDYVVLLSADDALAPGALARATALLDAHPSVGFAYGHPEEFVDELPPVSTRVRNWTVWSGGEWIERRCLTGRNCIMNPEVVLRTSVQHAIGGYDATLPHSGDMEMWLRAAAVNDVGRVNGCVQGYYRVHANSMQRTRHARYLIDLEGRLAAFEKVLTNSGARVTRSDQRLATAKRALAVSALQYARSALDSRAADREPVEDYLAFACRVWPPADQTRLWRALVRRVAADHDSSGQGVRPFARRGLDDVRMRLRWRRWRWTGV